MTPADNEDTSELPSLGLIKSSGGSYNNANMVFKKKKKALALLKVNIFHNPPFCNKTEIFKIPILYKDKC